MATPAMTVNAPSATTEVGFVTALRLKAARASTRVRIWLGEMAERTGLNKATSFIRRHITRAYRAITSVVRAAGVIPSAVLLVTSRTGQKVIGHTAAFAYGAFTWASGKFFGALNWLLRKFGKPGNAAADWVQETRKKTNNFVRRNALAVWAAVGPYFSPERLYMRLAKVGAYVAASVGLINTYVSGVWVIPAYLFAGAAGLLLSPTVRTSAMVRRVLGTFEDDAKLEAKRVVSETMEQMVKEYGPNVDSWSSAAKADYATKQGILRALNGDLNPFDGLTGNQRNKAEKWLRDFEDSVVEIKEAANVAVGESPVVVDPKDGTVHVPDTGEIIVK